MEIIEWANKLGHTIKIPKREADDLFTALDNALDDLLRRGDEGIGYSANFTVEIEEE